MRRTRRARSGLAGRRVLAPAAVIAAIAALSVVPGPIASAATPVHVYIAGDSTASTYVSSLAPRTGWGQALPVFLTPNAVAVNVARSGASSKSFIDLGRLDHILALIRKGDYLLISFGHNDEKIEDPARYTEPSTTYKSYLSQYIDKSRAKGAIPVLLTPVERRRFTTAGVISPTHGAYPAAMRELAAAKRVPLVDLTASSTALWNRAGVEGTKKYFMQLAAGQYPNYPDGSQDNTHFQAAGARDSSPPPCATRASCRPPTSAS
jgi:lysophospholipase L1-like esterase